MNLRYIYFIFVSLCVLASTSSSFAQNSSEIVLPQSFNGPSPPVQPAVISRDSNGLATIRAVRIASSLQIDGQFDELFYNDIQSMSEFIQVEPDYGALATNQTEVWLLYDNDNFYVSAKVWESHPERMIANELRHDAAQTLSQNELFNISIDSFYDRRNSYVFYINAIGGRGEGQVANESQFNNDWYGVWDAEVGRFDGGWTIEMAIPFKTLRYKASTAQIWGIQIQRINRWKNELSFLVPSDRSFGPRGFMLASRFATVVGIETPPPAINLEVKPYFISDLTTDRLSSPPLSNDVNADIGLDVKYAVTESLVADFTYNTDFAQVEADEQQVNLTRFSLFFPEKREFFLENSGLFAFGGAGTGPFGGGGDTPVLFYSRRIGLSGSREVPIQAGGRLTGRIGPYSIGVLDIRSDDEPMSGTRATNFTVARLKRDILRRSTVGLLFTGRSVAESGIGSNQTYGIDGNFAFFTNLAINTYWARTKTSGLASNDVSYRTEFDYAGDLYGVQLEHLLVGENFNPEIGFVRRDDMRKSHAQFRFSPRPGPSSIVRQYSWSAAGTYIENLDGQVESRELNGEFSVELQNSDSFNIGYTGAYELLPQPFRIAPGTILPIGAYDFSFVSAGFQFGSHRPIYGGLNWESGTFYNGHRKTFSIRQGRVRLTSQFSVEPSLSINWVDLPTGAFTASIVGTRVIYTITPMMFMSSLIQYNSSSRAVATNVRIRWEYLPGSELFVVYNEQRDTFGHRFPELTNRALIIKVNRLFRF